MALLAINHRLLNATIHNNQKFIFIGLIFILYFIWMDIALFVNLQRWSPPPISTSTSSSSILATLQAAANNKSYPANAMATADSPVKKVNLTVNHRPLSKGTDTSSIFKPLSVKLIMVDHVSHYVHDILARFIEDTLHFTEIFPWVTPNLVSYTGLVMAFVGSYLMISDKLLTRQIGSILFELRNLADGLDGVVYRSQLRKKEIELLNSRASAGASVPQESTIIYQSYYGTFGYNVDILCDGFGGIFLMIAILIRFLRHPPRKGNPINSASKLMLAPCVPSSTNNNHSNYSYHQLSNKCDDKSTECLEMANYDDESSEHTLSNRHPSSDTKSLHVPKNPERQVSINAAAFTAHMSEENEYTGEGGHVSSRQIKIIVASFGIRLLFTALIWDHFVHKYHDALMVWSNNPEQRKMQGQAFKSIGMWLIMWFWRLGCSCALLEHLCIANFVDKLWDYLVFSSYIGWAYLIILTLFTQIHYTELYEWLNTPFI